MKLAATLKSKAGKHELAQNPKYKILGVLS